MCNQNLDIILKWTESFWIMHNECIRNGIHQVFGFLSRKTCFYSPQQTVFKIFNILIIQHLQKNFHHAAIILVYSCMPKSEIIETLRNNQFKIKCNS